jgi:RNA polymerase sporulation-specific sigma factor
MSLTAAPATLSDHQSLSDEDLVARFQCGDDAALATLLRRYRGLARVKSRSYFLIGADADDIEQEGLIGLYKAARDYRPDRQASFRAFAELCVTRQVISAIKAATRHKHQPLNGYVSISTIRGSDDIDEHGLEELIQDHRAVDPADEVMWRHDALAMRRAIDGALSRLEIDVLNLYVSGRSYQEIGEHLGRHVKCVDNALQRIKRKLDEHLNGEQPEGELALAS